MLHGDLTPCNVLIEMEDIDQWSELNLCGLLGEPVRYPVYFMKEEDKNGCTAAPKFLYEPAKLMNLFKWCTANIRLIDFAGAFSIDQIKFPGAPTAPPSFQSPE